MDVRLRPFWPCAPSPMQAEFAKRYFFCFSVCACFFLKKLYCFAGINKTGGVFYEYFYFALL